MQTLPVDVPPYQIQSLITDDFGTISGARAQIRCAQALGSEIYVGFSNGELMRFALRAADPISLESYTILSRQSVAGEKPIDEIVLIPSLSRALILADHQIYFYTLPSLDPYPIKPLRHVITLAVDSNHLSRPSPSPGSSIEPVDFCIIKRNGIAMYTLKDKLLYTKEIPLPQGATLARRVGKALCIADNNCYSVVDLEGASMFPILPLSQAPDPTPFVVKPSITVIGNSEFLILSWTGASTLGLFITGDGDPVRGTLEWPSHPEAICLDYPHVTTLLPNGTIEIHNIETQALVQVIGAPVISPAPTPRVSSPTVGHHKRASSASVQPVTANPGQRIGMVASLGGYLVPSTQRSDRMQKATVKLRRQTANVNSSA